MAKTELKKKWWLTSKPKEIKGAELEKALGAVEAASDDKRIAALTALCPAIAKACKELDKNKHKDLLKELATLETLAEVEIKKLQAANKKADVEAKKQEQLDQKKAQDEEDGEEEDDQSGDTFKKLTTALKMLKLAQLPYYFLVCDAKPYGLIISKKDITKSGLHKKELSKVAGGSTRPPKFGTCRFENGKYVFEMEKPPSGLARILQKWIKDNLSLGVKVMVGTESAEDEVDQSKDSPGIASAQSESRAASAAEPAAAKAAALDKADQEKAALRKKTDEQAAEAAAAQEKKAQEKKALEERRTAFKKARATWIAVKANAEADLEKVKDGARMAYLADPKQYPKIEKGCKAIDAILDNLDDELRDTLDQYAATPLTNKKKLEQLAASATEVLDGYREYVAKDAVMKAIDEKEFANVTVHAPVLKALNDLRKALS